MDIDDATRRAGEAVAAAARRSQPPDIRVLKAGRRRRSFLAGSIWAGVAIAFAASMLAMDPAPTHPPIATGSTTTVPSIPTTSPTPTEPFPAQRRTIPGLGWEVVELPEFVADCHEAIVATELEVYFWGGDRGTCDYESPVGDPGLVYTPDTGFWRLLPPSPLTPTVGPTGVWTGEEVVICCGMHSNRAAAYSPETNSWRSLATAPYGGEFPKAVWTGSEMLLASQQGVASYDPAGDQWRTLASPPLNLGRLNEVLWTGAELIVWPRADTGPVQRRVFQGMAFDPSTDTWRILPDPPAWPARPDIVFTGEELIIWGGLPADNDGSERAVGSRLRIDTNEWLALPEALPEPHPCECNLGTQSLVWTGSLVIVWPGNFSSGLSGSDGMLLAYDPNTDTWSTIDGTGLDLFGKPLRTDSRILFRGVDHLYVSPTNWAPMTNPWIPE